MGSEVADEGSRSVKRSYSVVRKRGKWRFCLYLQPVVDDACTAKQGKSKWKESLEECGV